MLTRVVFLDRDGVINRDSPDYIRSWAEFEFLPGSLGAIARLTAAGAACIVVTNQSAVNRGLISPGGLERIHRLMGAAVRAAGGLLTDVFYCPHTPDEGCGCRKPKPGLIRQACRKYPIDLSRAVMVGDRAGDIACGRNAGCGRTLLVTGPDGSDARSRLCREGLSADHEVTSLSQGVEWILGHRHADP